MLAQERVPDNVWEWSKHYNIVATAESIGCAYHLYGAMELSTLPQLRLIEMDSGEVAELDSWEEATPLNYGTALRMMANHVQQDLEREHAEHPHRMGDFVEDEDANWPTGLQVEY